MTTASSPLLPPPLDLETQAAFLALLERLLPTEYLAPMKSGQGAGYEQFQAQASIGERLSLALVNLGIQTFIGSSSSPVRATGNVVLSRPNAVAGLVTVNAGTIVTTAKGDRRFATLAAVTFGIGDVGPHTVACLATAFGYEYNVRGQRTAANGEVLPGEIGIISRLDETPAYGDPSVAVSQVNDFSGGTWGGLDGLGADRGIARVPGETDLRYKVRIKALPDTVSPDALKRQVQQLLTQYNVAYGEFIETWQPSYQTCFDCPSVAPAGSGLDTNLFAYDDNRPATPFRDRWLDGSEYRGAFIFTVPNLAALRDVGMAFNDTAVTPADTISPSNGGQRATSAYDVPSTITSAVLQGGYDGFDLPKQAAYRNMAAQLEKIKAAGVAAIIELEGA